MASSELVCLELLATLLKGTGLRRFYNFGRSVDATAKSGPPPPHPRNLLHLAVLLVSRKKADKIPRTKKRVNPLFLRKGGGPNLAVKAIMWFVGDPLRPDTTLDKPKQHSNKDEFEKLQDSQDEREVQQEL